MGLTHRPPRVIRVEREIPAHADVAWDCAISDDGKLGLSIGGDRAGHLFNLQNGTRITSYSGSMDSCTGCALSFDGTLAAVSGGRESFVVWRTTDNKELIEVRSENNYGTHCSLTASGNSQCCTYSSVSNSVEGPGGSGEVIVLDHRTGKVSAKVIVKDGVPRKCTIAETEDIFAYVVHSEGLISEVRVHTLKEKNPKMTVSCSKYGNRPSVALQRNGKSLAVADSSSLRFCRTDVLEPEVLLHPYQNRDDAYCAISRDGSIIAATCTHAPNTRASCGVWSTTTGQQIAVLAMGGASPKGCALSQDSPKVLCGADDGVLRVWDVSTVLGVQEEESVLLHSEQVLEEFGAFDSGYIETEDHEQMARTLFRYHVRTGRNTMTHLQAVRELNSIIARLGISSSVTADQALLDDMYDAETMTYDVTEEQLAKAMKSIFRSAKAERQRDLSPEFVKSFRQATSAAENGMIKAKLAARIIADVANNGSKTPFGGRPVERQSVLNIFERLRKGKNELVSERDLVSVAGEVMLGITVLL